MSINLDTLITSFKFNVDKKSVKEVDKSLKDITKQALKVSAILLGAFGGQQFISKTESTVDSMAKFSRSIGITVSQLQSLQFVAKRSGVEIGGLESALTSITKIIGEVSRGAGGSGIVLARFGINIRNANGQVKNSFEILGELNKRFQTLSTSQQFDLASSMGIDAKTIKLLQQTPKEYDQLIKRSKQLGHISQANTKRAEAFEDSLVDLKTAFFNIGVEIASVFVPALSKMATAFANIAGFLSNHIELIKVISLAIGILVAGFAALKIQAIIAWAAAFAPAIAFTAAIVALIAIIAGVIIAVQDLWVGFKGGDSVIFDFIKNSETIQKVWSGIKKAFNEALIPFRELWSLAEKISKFMGIGKILGKAKDFAKKEIGAEINPTKNLLSPLVASAPLSSSSSVANTANTANNNINVGGITINSSTGNPKEISDSLLSNLKNHYQNSVNFFDGAIVR